jgi:hypothetical protein
MDKENGRTMVSDMGRAGEMVQTTLKKWILLLGLTMSTFGFGDTVLERKVLSDSGSIDCSKITWVKMFLTQNNRPFILVTTWDSGPYRLYTPNNVAAVKKEYGVYFGGYVKNDQVILTFKKEDNVVFYDVQKGFSRIKSVKITEELKWSEFEGIIPDSQEDDKFYIPCKRNTTPWWGRIIPAPDGSVCYAKPFLAEIKEDKILRDYAVKYGGRRNESYYACEVIGGDGMIHFLGFRDGTQRKNGVEVPMLYYAGYSTEEKKVVQSYDIFEKEKIGLNHFGPLSMVCKKNDVFIVFPWVIESQESILSDNIGKAISDIYYFQYCSKAASKTVQIAKGFQPSVKLDSRGKVYIFWLDYGGNLVCKTKQGNTWSKDKIILTGIDMVLSGIAVEFDSEDNLHLVYLSKGSLIYEKRKLSGN